MPIAVTGNGVASPGLSPCDHEAMSASDAAMHGYRIGRAWQAPGYSAPAGRRPTCSPSGPRPPAPLLPGFGRVRNEESPGRRTATGLRYPAAPSRAVHGNHLPSLGSLRKRPNGAPIRQRTGGKDRLRGLSGTWAKGGKWHRLQLQVRSFLPDCPSNRLGSPEGLEAAGGDRPHGLPPPPSHQGSSHGILLSE